MFYVLTPSEAVSTVPAMKAITAAINGRQGQIKKLQSDIEALQRATSILGGNPTATATRQPTTRRKRRRMSAAARKAVSERMKAYWAKRAGARR